MTNDLKNHCASIMRDAGLGLLWTDMGPTRDAFRLLKSGERNSLSAAQCLALRVVMAVWEGEADASILDYLRDRNEYQIQAMSSFFESLLTQPPEQQILA